MDTKRLPSLAELKFSARGQWPGLITSLSSIDHSLLDGRKHPCPRCGGNDRFRAFDDFAQSGGVVCSQCHNSGNADGFSTLSWLNGWSFPESVRAIAEKLGVAAPAREGAKRSKPKAVAKPSKLIEPGQPGKGASDAKPAPDSELRWLDWNPLLVARWCEKKKPIKPEALQLFAARLAKYKDFVVIVLPIYGQKLNEAEPFGYLLYNVTGDTLPTRDGPAGKKITWGSLTGVIGTVDRLKDKATRKIKTEGPTDALALLSVDLSTADAIFCNAGGANEDPDKPEFESLPSLVEGSNVVTVGDADKAGEDGVAKWSNYFAKFATSRVAKLPFEVVPSHGKDLRNWLADGNTREAFEGLIVSEPVVFKERKAKEVREAPEDPHRLARANLEHYRSNHNGELKHWRGQWMKWKQNHYRFIDDKEIAAKVNSLIKTEFDKAWEIDNAEHWRKVAENPDYRQPAPSARRVTASVVRDTLAALSSLCMLSSTVELNTWLDSRERRKYLACSNGILDIAAFVADAPFEQVFLNHSPKWFSTNCLAYNFNPCAECPTWDRYLYEATGGDQDKHDLLQEFAGYILSPDNSRSKFIALEGEGGNGKSVFVNGLTAILGEANISRVGLDVLGERFQAFSTFGKMLNVCSEANDIDSPAESFLKRFTGGEHISFERKNGAIFEAPPTAKLLLTWNVAPRFKDRSEGLWRRMMICKFNNKPATEDTRLNRAEWWVESGEVSGMLNWALVGLKRLEENRPGTNTGFTRTAEGERAKESIRTENNSARSFILENYHYCEGSHCQTKTVYEAYADWCYQSGHRAVNEVHFGREVRSIFKGLVGNEKKLLPAIGRARCYTNLAEGSSIDDQDEAPQAQTIQSDATCNAVPTSFDFS